MASSRLTKILLLFCFDGLKMSSTLVTLQAQADLLAIANYEPRSRLVVISFALLKISLLFSLDTELCIS